MPFKIVRNDITKMQTEAIVNTANEYPDVGTGCDHAVYEAAGREELLAYRKEHIGYVKQGEVFITPGFRLRAKYIIHAVSPLYTGGTAGEEALLRSCYRKSLALAAQTGIRSLAFPLISTGGFGYPKEEGMRIAVDEIHAFLLSHDMQIYLVVFDEKATRMGRSLYPDLEAYIDANYVEEKREREYDASYFSGREEQDGRRTPLMNAPAASQRVPEQEKKPFWKNLRRKRGEQEQPAPKATFSSAPGRPFEDAVVTAGSACKNAAAPDRVFEDAAADEDARIERMERSLAERMEHIADSFPQYLLYLIGQKGMDNAEVYKRAIVDKKVFSKIKNNPAYHPQKLTALCLCVGAKLNMDETRDLLARAGYALSPSDKTDIIFSYFIENKIYDMVELDIQLEEHGLPCIIS